MSKECDSCPWWKDSCFGCEHFRYPKTTNRESTQTMMKNLDKKFTEILMHYEDEALTQKQKAEMRIEFEYVCGVHYDGYDRARALEIRYHWGSINADLVKILHTEV